MKTKGLQKILKKRIYSIIDAQPANCTWCLCYLETEKSKEKKIRAGYYENGVFWDSVGEDASGWEQGVVGDCWKILEWMYIELDKK